MSRSFVRRLWGVGGILAVASIGGALLVKLPAATPPADNAAKPAMPAVPIVAATPPVAFAMPAAAVPQAASTQSSTSSTSSSTSSRSDNQSSGNWVWSDNGRKVEVSYRGDIEFTNDDVDVKRLSPGGYLRIKDGGRFGTSNSIEFRADGNGDLARALGGRVEPGTRREYGPARVRVSVEGGLFTGIEPDLDVWMNHGDHIAARNASGVHHGARGGTTHPHPSPLRIPPTIPTATKSVAARPNHKSQDDFHVRYPTSRRSRAQREGNVSPVDWS